MQFPITSQGVVDLAAGAGERGRIQDDQIVGISPPLAALEKGKDVLLLNGKMRTRLGRHFCAAFPRSRAPLSTRRDFERAMSSAGQAESALVRETIENPPASRVLRHDRIVFQLVEIETGFLALRQNPPKSAPLRFDLPLSRIFPDQTPGHQRQRLGSADRRVISLDDMRALRGSRTKLPQSALLPDPWRA